MLWCGAADPDDEVNLVDGPILHGTLGGLKLGVGEVAKERLGEVCRSSALDFDEQSGGSVAEVEAGFRAFDRLKLDSTFVAEVVTDVFLGLLLCAHFTGRVETPNFNY